MSDDSRTASHVSEYSQGVSVVVPVFRSTSTLAPLAERTAKALEGTEFELILVDDGSPADTWAEIKRLTAANSRIHGVRLSRRSGQHSALLAGIRGATFEVTVTIDDDLQNPPEEIPRLLTSLTDNFDVVYGAPATVAQPFWRRATSALMRRILALVIDSDNGATMSSYRAFRTRLRDGFDGNLGPSVSVDALLAWSTSRFTTVRVDHHARTSGASNYRLRSLLRFAIDTATGYSTAPLQFALMLGLLTALFGLAVLVWVITSVIIHGGSVPGFPFLASIIAIFSGVQLFTLGIFGEYLARMHFRVMRKPSYVIAERTDRHPKGADESTA